VVGAPGPARLSLLLNAEISAVITAMRANAKWAVVPNKYNVSSVPAAPWSVGPGSELYAMIGMPIDHLGCATTITRSGWPRRRRIIWSQSHTSRISAR
jgi:hypothetical protein